MTTYNINREASTLSFFLDTHQHAHFFGFFRCAVKAFFYLLNQVGDVHDSGKVGRFGHAGDVGLEPLLNVSFRLLFGV
jgi:hypothetical protein